MRGKPSGSVLPESTFVENYNLLKKKKIIKQKFGLQHRRSDMSSSIRSAMSVRRSFEILFFQQNLNDLSKIEAVKIVGGIIFLSDFRSDEILRPHIVLVDLF